MHMPCLGETVISMVTQISEVALYQGCHETISVRPLENLRPAVPIADGSFDIKKWDPKTNMIRICTTKLRIP